MFLTARKKLEQFSWPKTCTYRNFVSHWKQTWRGEEEIELFSFATSDTKPGQDISCFLFLLCFLLCHSQLVSFFPSSEFFQPSTLILTLPADRFWRRNISFMHSFANTPFGQFNIYSPPRSNLFRGKTVTFWNEWNRWSLTFYWLTNEVTRMKSPCH